LAGAGVGAVAAAAVARSNPPVAFRGAAVGLVAAAAVYPIARRRGHRRPSGAERAALAATVGVLGMALSDPQGAGRLVGIGWAAHALFDALVEHDHARRLPRWYPPLCAGYDLAFGAALCWQAAKKAP
jgi:hypothetical protein